MPVPGCHYSGWPTDKLLRGSDVSSVSLYCLLSCASVLPLPVCPLPLSLPPSPLSLCPWSPLAGHTPATGAISLATVAMGPVAGSISSHPGGPDPGPEGDKGSRVRPEV